MELTVVGSGTVVPAPDRVCSGYWVRAAGRRMLLDCGPGVTHHLARFGLPWPELDYLVLSHFHTDHVGGIPALLFALKHGLSAPRTTPLEVVGPTGTRRLLEAMASAFGDYLLDPGFPLIVREVDPGDGADRDPVKSGTDAAEIAPGLFLRASQARHTPEALCWRVESRGAALAYSGDTGFAPGLARFFRGAALLVCECSLPDELAMETHLTPTSLARIAEPAGPGILVVTHVYPQLARQDVEGQLRAAGWSGRTILARDGLTLEVTRGGER